MSSSEPKAAWSVIRVPLLVVAAVHVLVLLRSARFEPLGPESFLARHGGQVVRWLAWSLIAPAIGLLARRFATTRPRWGQALVLLLGGCAVSMSLYYVLEELLKVAFLGRPFFEYFSETLKNLLWNWDLPIFGLILSTSLAFEYYHHNRLREVQASRLQKELAESTLATLKVQLQPHFLFNTLHLISALVRSNPDAAEQTIARLSDLLRASMKGAGTSEVELTAELDMLMNYVGILQTRFGERLRFDLDVHPETAESLVPAFSLQTLVENAVRHGVARKVEGGTIRVNVFRSSETLVVRVSDTGPGFSGDWKNLLREGSGLSNLSRRMELLYPGAFRFELLGNEGGGTLAVFEIPFRSRDHGSR